MNNEEIHKEFIDLIEKTTYEDWYYVSGTRDIGKSYFQNLLNEKDKEIERLNNIINELEKYLIEEIEDYKKQIKYHKKNKDIRSGILDLVGEYEGEKVCFEDMLGKLQELKGADKE